MKGRVFIIDGSSVLYRSFYALPRFTNSMGIPTNAIYGFHNIIRKLIKEEKPEYLVVAFDVKGKTLRHELFEKYKAQRKPMPGELELQIPYVKKLLDAMKLPYIENPRYEADDLMASIANKLKKMGYEAVIVTSDKDLLQILDEGVKIYNPGKESYITRENCKEYFGAEPEQVVDVLSLMGDPVDNIPGVKGIGKKTAEELIGEFGNLDNLLGNLDKLKPKVREAIQEHMDDLKLSRELVEIESSLPIKINIDAYKIREPDIDSLIPLLRELEFSSLLKEYTKEKVEESDYKLIKSMDELRKVLSNVKDEISFDTETTDQRPVWAELIGISISFKEGHAFYIPIAHREFSLPKEEALKELSKVLSNKKVRKYGHNLKYDIIVLKREGIEVNGLDKDSMILSYLISPERRRHNLESLVLDVFGKTKKSYNDVTSKGKLSFDSLPLEVAAKYSCGDADYAFRLGKVFYPKICEEGLENLYRNIELPLIEVLANMEMTGVKLDVKKLTELSGELGGELMRLEDEIYKKVGIKFNINSPKQLGEILFEKLNLPLVKKTKKTKGYSTDVGVLTELAARHEVPALVLKYRQLSKVKSTYIDALPRMINPETKRIHTSYNQTVTATGRLSSSDPNLQNIPIRGELGKKVREAFIAEQGNLLLSADYSQIELRVMAHMSGDDNLINAFKVGEDIHSATAREVFGEVDLPPDEKRRRAKIINFSIIYGTSAYSLSKELGVDVHEATDFIKRYFEKYPKVREFIEKTVNDAKEKGYVKTLFGRKRKIPELRSANKNVQAAGERIAMNTPIQGTAADIMKKAMIDVWRALKKGKYKTKIIMQVHDELIFEIPENEIEPVRELIKREMEGTFKLSVPLVVDIAYGKNWTEAKG